MDATDPMDAAIYKAMLKCCAIITGEQIQIQDLPALRAVAARCRTQSELDREVAQLFGYYSEQAR